MPVNRALAGLRDIVEQVNRGLAEGTPISYLKVLEQARAIRDEYSHSDEVGALYESNFGEQGYVAMFMADFADHEEPEYPLGIRRTPHS